MPVVGNRIPPMWLKSKKVCPPSASPPSSRTLVPLPSASSVSSISQSACSASTRTAINLAGVAQTIASAALTTSLNLGSPGFMFLSLCHCYSRMGASNVPVDPHLEPGRSHLRAKMEILAALVHVVGFRPYRLSHRAVHEPAACAGTIHLSQPLSDLVFPILHPQLDVVLVDLVPMVDHWWIGMVLLAVPSPNHAHFRVGFHVLHQRVLDAGRTQHVRVQHHQVLALALIHEPIVNNVPCIRQIGRAGEVRVVPGHDAHSPQHVLRPLCKYHLIERDPPANRVHPQQTDVRSVDALAIGVHPVLGNLSPLPNFLQRLAYPLHPHRRRCRRLVILAAVPPTHKL